MSTIVSIKGTNGSGKSSVVRELTLDPKEPTLSAYQLPDDDEDVLLPPLRPVHSQQPEAREIPPALPKIASRAQGHRFAQTHNGQKCIACNIHFSTYQSTRRPCPNEEMEIEAVDVSKPATPKATPNVDFRNPLKTHKWKEDVCTVCGVDKTDARLENIFCTDAELRG